MNTDTLTAMELLLEYLKTIGVNFGILPVPEAEVLEHVLMYMSLVPHMRGPVADRLTELTAQHDVATRLLHPELVQSPVYKTVIEDMVREGVSQSLLSMMRFDNEGNMVPLYTRGLDGVPVPDPQAQIFRKLAITKRGDPDHDALQYLLPPDSDLVVFAPRGALSSEPTTPINQRTAADVMAFGVDELGRKTGHLLVCPHPDPEGEGDFGRMHNDNLGFDTARALEIKDPSERLDALLEIDMFLAHLERVVQYMAAAQRQPRNNFIACFHMLGHHSVNWTHMHVVNITRPNIVSLALQSGKNCLLETVAAIVVDFIEKTKLQIKLQP